MPIRNMQVNWNKRRYGRLLLIYDLYCDDLYLPDYYLIIDVYIFYQVNHCILILDGKSSIYIQSKYIRFVFLDN